MAQNSWLSLITLPPLSNGHLFGELLLSDTDPKKVAERYFEGRVQDNPFLVCAALQIAANSKKVKKRLVEIDIMLERGFDPDWKLKALEFRQLYDKDPDFKERVEKANIKIQELYKVVVCNVKTTETTMNLYLLVDRAARCFGKSLLPKKTVPATAATLRGSTRNLGAMESSVVVDPSYAVDYVELLVRTAPDFVKKQSSHITEDDLRKIVNDPEHPAHKFLMLSLTLNLPHSPRRRSVLPPLPSTGSQDWVTKEEQTEIDKILLETNHQTRHELWTEFVQKFSKRRDHSLQKVICYLFTKSPFFLAGEKIKAEPQKVLDEKVIWKKKLTETEQMKFFSDLHLRSIVALLQSDISAGSTLPKATKLYNSIVQHFVQELLDENKTPWEQSLLVKNLIGLIQFSLKQKNFFVAQSLHSVFEEVAIARLRLHLYFQETKVWEKSESPFKSDNALREVYNQSEEVFVPSSYLMVRELELIKEMGLGEEKLHSWRGRILALLYGYSKMLSEPVQFQTSLDPQLISADKNAFKDLMFEKSEKILAKKPELPPGTTLRLNPIYIRPNGKGANSSSSRLTFSQEVT